MQPAKGMDAVGSVFTPALLKNMSGDTHVGGEIIILILPDRINTGFRNELMPPEVSSLRHLKNMSGDTHVGGEGALKSAGFDATGSVFTPAFKEHEW